MRFTRLNSGVYLSVLLSLFLGVILFGAEQPPFIEKSSDEPVKYVGDREVDISYHNGALPYAVGGHHYQAHRANRTNPAVGGLAGWTYSHQPYLAYWNGKFYLQYLSNLKEENGPPGRTLIMTSPNGRDWSAPRIVFPKYPLPEIRLEDIPERLEEIRNKVEQLPGGYIPAGTFSVMHQRMGFYIAPNGRLLTLGFHSYCPDHWTGPNKGQGIGRVVREIYKDGGLGPIYFIRYNRHAGWSEKNTLYPFYEESDDEGFVQACKYLLHNVLMRLQWWEEDQARDDEFYTIKPWETEGFEGKAFWFCHRPDGSVLGIWKRSWAALSPDEGLSWTKPVKCPTLLTCHAKVMIKKASDGRYAMVYNRSSTGENRFPLSIMVSDDCHKFDNLLCLQGEVPPRRYQGVWKDRGPQYPRGIIEGNGEPPGDDLWVTYSVNKEDIWVSSVKVPVVGEVKEHVSQDFEGIEDESELDLWNLYVPKWTSLSILKDPEKDDNRCLGLMDEEPYDYVRVQRAFPSSGQIMVQFRVLVQKAGQSILFAEVQDARGRRPMRLRIESDRLTTDRGTFIRDPIAIRQDKWYKVQLKLDCDRGSYDLALNGKWVQKDIEFAEKVGTLKRIVFRTGPWRKDVRPLLSKNEDWSPIDGTTGLCFEDKPGADHQAALSSFLIDDVATQAIRQKKARPDLSKAPGIVIDHIPAKSGMYVGSPSIAVLSNGNYVASHDFFGPESKKKRTAIFVSEDRGKSWTKSTELEGQFWSNLFTHKDSLYIMGTSRQYGDVVIRRSDDGGKSWTEPADESNGLLLGGGRYHTAPVPVVKSRGRIWRAMEYLAPGHGWGRFQAFVMSAPVQANLLKAENWQCSEKLIFQEGWSPEESRPGWLEGNIVVTPEGELVNILRLNFLEGGKAALIHISDNGRELRFNPEQDVIDFPGGSKKFTIRYDEKSGLYWSLTNIVPRRDKSIKASLHRNILALTASADLRNWKIRSTILYHPDIKNHGFQYIDWLFDKDDIVFVSRTAYDDGLGGAHNQHDANYLTFHRIRDFRDRMIVDDVLH